jgi:hypothetical protein
LDQILLEWFSEQFFILNRNYNMTSSWFLSIALQRLPSRGNDHFWLVSFRCHQNKSKQWSKNIASLFIFLWFTYAQ